MENAMEMVVAQAADGSFVELSRGQAIAAGLVVIAVIAAVGYAGYRYGKGKAAKDLEDRLDAIEGK